VRNEIGLVRGQFGGVPEEKWIKFIAEAGFDGWEEAAWELDLRDDDGPSRSRAHYPTAAAIASAANFRGSDRCPSPW